MNNSARKTIFGLVILASGLVFAQRAYGADPQKCTTGQTCKIGEFLYDDEYNPITTAICSITSRDPDGNSYLSGASLTHTTNGYYIYSITPTSLGLYPTQICCVVDGENMCLDKTFEVVSTSTGGGGSSLTAADVWNYNDRSLTSFGSLVSDIWGYSSRSLTSFGNLVSDIWNRSDRTLTQSVNVDTTGLATSADILAIKKQNQENRLLLEKLVNKPIIESFIDDKTPIVDLNKKLTETQNVLNSLFNSTQNLKTRAQILSDNWLKLTTTQAKEEIKSLKEQISDQGSETTINSQINWLRTTWGSTIHFSISDQANSINTQIDSIQLKLLTASSNLLFSDIQKLNLDIFKLTNQIGHNLSLPSDDTAYGNYQKIKNQTTEIDQHQKNLTDLIGQEEKSDQLEKTQQKILSINLVPEAENILKSSKKNTYKNKIYSLLTLLDLNKKILAGDNSKSIKIMWLEDGSVVFRTVATNPSKSISQSVNVKFYLPEELKKEQILSNDPQLKIDYDPIQKSLFAEANVELSPLETVTLAVETEDIWRYSEDQINLLKKQATDLSEATKGGDNYPQAKTIKSDIHTILDKVILRQSEVITPESRIKAYRESALEILNAEEKIESLKQLSFQNVKNSTNSELNSQNLAIIGVIIMGLSSLFFLGYYLKVISKQRSNLQQQTHNSLGEQSKPTQKHLRTQVHKKINNRHFHRLTAISILILFASGLLSVIWSFGLSQIQDKKAKELTIQNDPAKQPKKAIIDANSTQKVIAKAYPSLVAPEIHNFNKEETVYIYQRSSGWAKIGQSETETETDKVWWVSESDLK